MRSICAELSLIHISVTIVVQTIGAGTERMMALNEGDSLEDFVGPLGCPSELCQEDNLEETKKKHIVFIAGGLGTCLLYTSGSKAYGISVQGL